MVTEWRSGMPNGVPAHRLGAIGAFRGLGSVPWESPPGPEADLCALSNDLGRAEKAEHEDLHADDGALAQLDSEMVEAWLAPEIGLSCMCSVGLLA